MTAADRAAASDPGFAPAKINLFLHLRGRRHDGYHLLDSLVVFAGAGDGLFVREAEELTLEIDGPFSSGLNGPGNLCLRAADALARYHGKSPGAALHLTKNLPVASGIGGGSSDAAATLRLLSDLWEVEVPDGLALGLGADVPVCMDAPMPRMMSGIGEVLGPAPPLPDCWMVLVNPGVAVPTGAVFAGVEDHSPPPGPALPPGGIAEFDAFRAFLLGQRNDLEPAARALCPAIGDVLDALSGAPLARMSGSGATCFAVFPDEAEARNVAERLRAWSDWWIVAVPMLGHSPSH